MDQVRSYTKRVEALLSTAGVRPTPGEVIAALDGRAWAAVRGATTRTERQKLGIFFTPSAVARRAAELLELGNTATVFDPACGAGDLLLAAADLSAAVEDDSGLTLEGVDVVPELTALARARIKLLGAARGWPDAWARSHRIAVGNGLRNQRAYARATHVVMNPPFITMQSQDGLAWKDGAVSLAARFVEHALRTSKEGTVLVAVLPEVLRSGSGYRHWRHHMGRLAGVDHLETQDRFNGDADVHTFVVRFRRGKTHDDTSRYWSTERTGRSRRGCLHHHFDVSVGPVVEYRSPRAGDLVPFLRPSNCPPWGTVASVDGRRRFAGRLVAPPFLVVRRTSRPEQPHRVVATFVSSGGPYAVENHLLVLKPSSGQANTCREAMEWLRSEQVSDWMNERIRCRHLTVGSVQELPLPDQT